MRSTEPCLCGDPMCWRCFPFPGRRPEGKAQRQGDDLDAEYDAHENEVHRREVRDGIRCGGCGRRLDGSPEGCPCGADVEAPETEEVSPAGE